MSEPLAELVAALREAVEALWEVRLDATKYDDNDAVIERGQAILRQIDGPGPISGGEDG